MDFVLIGHRYLILSARTYSSRTCSMDISHQHTTIILRLTIFSPYSLSLSRSLSSHLYSTAFVTFNNMPFSLLQAIPEYP